MYVFTLQDTSTYRAFFRTDTDCRPSTVEIGSSLDLEFISCLQLQILIFNLKLDSNLKIEFYLQDTRYIWCISKVIYIIMRSRLNFWLIRLSEFTPEELTGIVQPAVCIHLDITIPRDLYILYIL